MPLFNKSVEEHIHNFGSHSQPNLNWNAVKKVYRAAGDMVIGMPFGRKPWMSNSTWALMEMRNNLKKVIEATPVCSRSALESEYKTKNREVNWRRDKRSHVEKLSKSGEDAAFVGDKR